MYLIQSGKEFVQRIDGRNGEVHWTSDREEAKRFSRIEFAKELAEGIGRVVRA